ncbi:hypothetical protein IC229_29650 [Spirosoma sp. BT702]|uniref:Uncharacterized protein n=1 Tax=Spirosoma profusum TaxID=2771354 RepID=A0A927AUV0_9BACT|nr:hypothetical protein [Spirosoma profusum]MBD2704833.1 hypothetical protein [Spirosoma profusum]
MDTNTLVIITGYGSVSPKPLRKAYLNKSEETARLRFIQQNPGVRDVSAVLISFDDEFTIRSNGEIVVH